MCLVCSIAAVLTTLLRLHIRRGQLWWDDLLAFLSMVFLLVHVTGVVLYVQDTSVYYIFCADFLYESFTFDVAEVSRNTMVAAYYIMATQFSTVIW